MFTRLAKYIIEGFVVGIVAIILPEQPLPMEAALMLALVAAACFAVLDLVAPSIGSSARQGVGLGMPMGLNLLPIM